MEITKIDKWRFSTYSNDCRIPVHCFLPYPPIALKSPIFFRSPLSALVSLHERESGYRQRKRRPAAFPSSSSSASFGATATATDHPATDLGSGARMGKGGSSSSSSAMMMMMKNEGIVRKILLSYAYVGIWIFLSFTVIVFNKYILDRKLYNWPFPISLTMIHMSFCSLLAFLLVRVFRLVEPPQPMSRHLYLSSVLPIGALYALSLWLSNSAYIYLSVSFIQMLKALMPVAVYSISVAFRRDPFNSHTMANMLAISFGVGVAAYGEARFDSWGVFLQLGAVAFEATRLVLIQILLTSKGITLNPITSLYYVAPCCLAFLAVPWLLVEFPLIRDTSSFHLDYWIFGANSLCAFALNLAVFLLIGKTSALTMNVAGVVKDWLLIAFSWSVIKDSITPINLFGYAIAFLGVCYYNHIKLQALKMKEAQKKSSQVADEEAGLLPESRSGGNSPKENEPKD